MSNTSSSNNNSSKSNSSSSNNANSNFCNEKKINFLPGNIDCGVVFKEFSLCKKPQAMLDINSLPIAFGFFPNDIKSMNRASLYEKQLHEQMKKSFRANKSVMSVAITGCNIINGNDMKNKVSDKKCIKYVENVVPKNINRNNKNKFIAKTNVNSYKKIRSKSNHTKTVPLKRSPILLKEGPAEAPLPKGWTVRIYKRTSCGSYKKFDHYWYSPKLKRKFRSMAEVE
jgi:hypothetical protein